MAESEGQQMKVADKKTAHEWFLLIEDGVPQDRALELLEKEATSAEVQYRNAWIAARKEKIPKNLDDLSEAEYVAVRIYTSDKDKFYRKFNKDCRDRKWKHYTVLASLLHSGICKRRRKHADKVEMLYRGINCYEIASSADEVFMACFTSTSSLQEKTKPFGTTTMTVATSTLPSIAEFSTFTSEAETLISPFQAFINKKGSKIAMKTSIDATSPFLGSPLFRGSLLGVVVGNCIGSSYEFKTPPLTVEQLLKNLSELENQKTSKGKYRYTADTSMTLALANCLTTKTKTFLNVEDVKRNIADVKKSLAEAYVKDPNRNYGKSLVQVLMELHKQTKDDDPLAPAKRLFNGEGSLGNGGAMRIVPVALCFSIEREKQFNEIVKSITELTHSNLSAINGAILQATAIQKALEFSIYQKRTEDFNKNYLGELLKHMKSVEPGNHGPYSSKLQIVQKFLSSPPTAETVRNELGNGITAEKSVPTAIYCFLRGMHSIEGIPSDRSEFERTVIYAISLGGDTDTIASMAGAIAGAYYGQDSITQRWRDLCEASAIEDAKRYANEFISPLFYFPENDNKNA